MAKWAELDGRDPAGVQVRSTVRISPPPRRLGAAHRGTNGWVAVIVGQDVADQLVCDQVKAMLKKAREYAKSQRADPLSTANGGGGRNEDPVDEDAAKEQRRRERAEQQRPAARPRPTTPSWSGSASFTSPG